MQELANCGEPSGPGYSHGPLFGKVCQVVGNVRPRDLPWGGRHHIVLGQPGYEMAKVSSVRLDG